MSAYALPRCPWRGIEDPLYARYHDEEWGVPQADSQILFEKLILEGFQAGLSWLTILRKRENFRRAFHGFDAEFMACLSEADSARLMADQGIIRHRLKIQGAILSAQAFLDLSKRGSLAEVVWDIVDGKPIQNQRNTLADIPAETPASQRLSKQLKALGFRFVGPTTVYAFMQSMGLVNDHLMSCPRHDICQSQGAKFKRQLRG